MSEPWLIALQTAAMSGWRGLDLGDHRLEGQAHVRAGVAVGHRVDVEPVDRLAVRRQGVSIRRDQLPQFVRVEEAVAGHPRDATGLP